MRPLIRVPSFHVHIAICVGDDEDVDITALLKGWRGKVLRRLGFTVADRWVLVHRPYEVHIVPVGDGMSHDLHASECVCGPFGACERHAGAPDTWLFTHASLDSREPPPSAEELTP